MEETYKQRKQREERERRFQRKKRLENARRVYLDFINDPKAFNLGVKFNIIDQMSEELAQYLDMVDCRRILTGMLEFVYDPASRPEDPVDYFASLTKDRKIDKRELNKARRHLYQLMWKEYEIREEIAKLKTLLALTSPRDYKQDGTERTEEEKIEYDQSQTRGHSLNEDFIKEESFKSLMSHQDMKIPPVFGTYSVPTPEPVAVSGKDVIAERSDIEKGRKRKGTRARSKSLASRASRKSNAKLSPKIEKKSSEIPSKKSVNTSEEESAKSSRKTSRKGSTKSRKKGSTRRSKKRSKSGKRGKKNSRSSKKKRLKSKSSRKRASRKSKKSQ